MRRRSQRGQAVSILAVVLAAFGVVALGMLAFEVSRVVVARDQLRTATEAAALAGAGALAGTLDEDIATGQQNAIDAAKQVMAANDVIGEPLNKQLGPGEKPKAGEVALTFRLLDPKNDNAEVKFGDPKGKLLEVNASFGYTTSTGKYIGIGQAPTPIQATAVGGAGDLDVSMCFDISGSMDDATPTTLVCRTFNRETGKMDYKVASGPGGGQGLLTIDLNQSGIGAVPPQDLDYSSGYRFSPELRALDKTPPASPPGPSTFTDLVVNIDGNKTFGGLSADGFSFPNLAALVEASRGNLDSADKFTSSGADITLRDQVAPKAGYQAKYLELAHRNVHPIVDAQDAAQDFFKQMNRGTDGHFGFVAFQSAVGVNALSTYRGNNVAPSFAAGGSGDFALPLVELDPADDVTNFDTIMDVIPKVVPEGGTNIGGSLEAAINDLQEHGRKNSKKVIILFTDGVPTVGTGGSPESSARRAAQKAKSKGICIFTIGLCLDPSSLSEQERVLNDTNSSPTNGGIAAIAGNGGKFFQTSDPRTLKSAFSKVARQLTQLTQ